MTSLRWTSRVLALAMVLFSLPFYLGYGNPLPFADPANAPLDNLWLAAMPLVYAGLVLGWRYPRLGGWIVIIPIVIGQLATLFLERELVGPMLFPLIPAALYLFLGCRHASGSRA